MALDTDNLKKESLPPEKRGHVNEISLNIFDGIRGSSPNLKNPESIFKVGTVTDDSPIKNCKLFILKKVNK